MKTKKQLATETRIVKKLMNRNELDEFKGFIESNSRYAFTDGKRIIALDHKAEQEKAMQSGDAIKRFLNVNECKLEMTKEFKVNVEHLKEFIKENKQHLKTAKIIPYRIMNAKGKEIIALNASFLLDSVEITNSNVFYYKNNISPIVQYTEDEKEIVTYTLPLNPNYMR